MSAPGGNRTIWFGSVLAEDAFLLPLPWPFCLLLYTLAKDDVLLINLGTELLLEPANFRQPLLQEAFGGDGFGELHVRSGMQKGHGKPGGFSGISRGVDGRLQ